VDTYHKRGPLDSTTTSSASISSDTLSFTYRSEGAPFEIL